MPTLLQNFRHYEILLSEYRPALEKPLCHPQKTINLLAATFTRMRICELCRKEAVNRSFPRPWIGARPSQPFSPGSAVKVTSQAG